MLNSLEANKILITGSTGLIGQALVREFVSRSMNYLYLPVRDLTQAQRLFGKIIDLARDRCRIEFIECDLTKLADHDFDRLVSGCRSVIHLAGLVHQPHAEEKDYTLCNVQVTERLMSAGARAGIENIIFMSSIAIYGSGTLQLIEESAPLLGRTPYAVSKINCENILEEFSSIPKIIILRPALVFGIGDKGNLIKLIQSINKGRYFNVNGGKTTKSLIFASDLGRAIILCLNKLPWGRYTFNVANPEPVSMQELSKTISLALTKDGKTLSLPAPFLRTGIKTADLLLPKSIRKKIPVSIDQIDKITTTTTCSVDKLMQATGFLPRYSLLAAVTAEICWAKNNNLLN